MRSAAHLNFDLQEPTITSEMDQLTTPADELQKLAEYVRTLQEERGKVEAFKRELPLCMQLIDEAIEAANQKVMEDQCSPSTASVLDAEINSDSERSKGTGNSFMSLKRRWCEHQKDKIRGQGEVCHDSEQHHKVVLRQPVWRGKAQLRTHQSDCTVYEKHSSSRGTKRRVDFGGSEQARTTPLTSSRLHLSSNHRQGGAFVPFVRERQLNSPLICSQATECVPDAAADKLLRVSSSAVRSAGQNGQSSGDFDVGVNAQVRGYHGSDARMSTEVSRQTKTSACQPQRKVRRCWSPELHERFVSALQQLGGPQVATPKQIRELMKVDSLTNDEVKSHLQKYRLHTSRPSPLLGSPSPHAPQLVVLGWMRPDQFKAAVGAASQPSKGACLNCDNPKLVMAQKHTPPESTEQPRTKPLPVLQIQHLSAISQSPSLRGSASTTPNSSTTDLHLDEGDDVQERKAVSSGDHAERVQLVGKLEQRELQSAVESKGSTTSLVAIGIDSTTQIQRDCNVKLLHTKAAA